MKNLHAPAKMKLTKVVVTRYTKLQGTTGFLSTSIPPTSSNATSSIY